MIDTRYVRTRTFHSESVHYKFLHFKRYSTNAAIYVTPTTSTSTFNICTCCRSGTRYTTDCVRTGPVPKLATFTVTVTCLLAGRAAGPRQSHRLRNRALAFGWAHRPIEPTLWPERHAPSTNWHRLFYCPQTMAQKLTANRSSAREARSGGENVTVDPSRSPWPARGPLGRLREARQGPGGA